MTAPGGRAFAGLALAVLLGSCSDPAEPSAAPAGAVADPRPDVVLLMLDTVRPDHLGPYGYERDTTPFLKELAGSGAVFANAHSTSSWTAPAVASILTGLYPTEHGVIEGFLAYLRREQKEGAEVLPLNRLPAELLTMTQHFKDAGYRTWGIATNLNVGPEIGLDRGFDRFAQIAKGDAPAVAARLGEWREDLRAPGGPDFLYLHFMDAHEPYHRRAPWYEPQRGTVFDQMARYDSELHYLDQTLAGLYESFGWAENTLLVIVSDHGEEFREHGQMGHEFTLYRELNQVVFLVRPPGGMAGRTIPSDVSLIDVLPTTLALAGVEVPPGLEGMSLVPLILGQADAPAAFARRTLFAHRFQLLPQPEHLWSAVRGEHRLIRGPGGLELYDRLADPTEQRNLLDADPDAAAGLLPDLEGFQRRGIRQAERVEVGRDPALLEELGRIGYVRGGEDDENDG